MEYAIRLKGLTKSFQKEKVFRRLRNAKSRINTAFFCC